VGVNMGFVVEKVTMGQVFFRVLWFFPVSVIPSCLSMLIYHLGMNNRPDAGRSSETQSHPIDTNSNIYPVSVIRFF
jgi:ABC-type sugar transport system permease subunit